MTPPWLNTATVSSWSAAATMSSTPALTRAMNAGSSTPLGRSPLASRFISSAEICSTGV